MNKVIVQCFLFTGIVGFVLPCSLFGRPAGKSGGNQVNVRQFRNEIGYPSTVIEYKNNKDKLVPLLERTGMLMGTVANATSDIVCVNIREATKTSFSYLVKANSNNAPPELHYLNEQLAKLLAAKGVVINKDDIYVTKISGNRLHINAKSNSDDSFYFIEVVFREGNLVSKGIQVETHSRIP